MNLGSCQKNPSHLVKQNILGRIAKMCSMTNKSFAFILVFSRKI